VGALRIDHSDLLGRAVRVFAQPLARLAGALTGDGIDDMYRNGEARLIRLLLPFLGARSVVMDVGANIGRWSAFLLDLAPAVSLHAFEPNPAAHAELRRNLPGRAGVATHPLALGSAPAKATLYSDPRHTALSSLHHRDLGSFGVSLAGELEVSVETVDRRTRSTASP
jgi:FkbM family methyltransferase